MITTTDTTKATSMATSSAASSTVLNANPNFTIFNRLAPNMTGIARKKVNSAATGRDMPSSSAPTIVAPERDVPGNTAAMSWNTPMMRAA